MFACFICHCLFRLRFLIGLSNWIIKSDKSWRHAKTIRNVAGGKFTCGFAAREFPRRLREGIWPLRRPLARSRIPPAIQARSCVACVAGGISRASAFVLVVKPWTRVARWEHWWRVELNSLAASPLLNSFAGFAREIDGSAARSPARPLPNPASYAG